MIFRSSAFVGCETALRVSMLPFRSAAMDRYSLMPKTDCWLVTRRGFPHDICLETRPRYTSIDCGPSKDVIEYVLYALHRCFMTLRRCRHATVRLSITAHILDTAATFYHFASLAMPRIILRPCCVSFVYAFPVRRDIGVASFQKSRCLEPVSALPADIPE